MSKQLSTKVSLMEAKFAKSTQQTHKVVWKYGI